MTNAERQARWLEKNRALFNLRRRNARKKLGGAEKQGIEEPAEGGLSRKTEAFEGELARLTSNESNVCPTPAQTFKDETLERVRGLMKVEQEKPIVEVPVKPKMHRTETGMLVPDEVWQEREEYKRKSREKGFVPDEYSQA